MKGWIGDLVDNGPGRFLGPIHIPMATAIVRTYTSEGFIIAADGRTSEEADEGIISVNDKTQKIFPIGGSNPKFLAYSISGSVAIPSKDATECAFKFREEINRVVQAVSAQRYSDLSTYAKRAFGAVHRLLKDAKMAGQLDYPSFGIPDPSEPGSTIVRVFLDGYHKGFPHRVKVRFFHDNQELAPLEVLAQALEKGQGWFQGSEKVSGLFWPFVDKRSDGPDWFSAYYEEVKQMTFHPTNEILDGHAREAYAYIAMCSGPEARRIDPSPCAAIGGHIHIATITPKEGFQWLTGFEPIPLP